MPFVFGKSTFRSIGTLVCLVVGVSCRPKKQPVVSPWDRAAAFVERQCTEKYLRQESVFPALEGVAHAPSVWAGYLFSVNSTRNWVTEEELDALGVRPRDALVVPDSVWMHAGPPDPSFADRQVVVAGDDARSVVVVEGYVRASHGGIERVFVKELPFPEGVAK